MEICNEPQVEICYEDFSKRKPLDLTYKKESGTDQQLLNENAEDLNFRRHEETMKNKGQSDLKKEIEHLKKRVD